VGEGPLWLVHVVEAGDGVVFVGEGNQHLTVQE
jgi:hypothetical protein